MGSNPNNATIRMETSQFKRFLDELGGSVHSLNTIAVALSKLSDSNSEIPDGLDISWKPNNLETSTIKARTYAEKAALVYCVESYYEYLSQISTNPFWTNPEINLIGDEKKADKVYNFLTQIPSIKVEEKILAEFSIHWRNRIVHKYTSKASLSSKKTDQLLKLKKEIPT